MLRGSRLLRGAATAFNDTDAVVVSFARTPILSGSTPHRPPLTAPALGAAAVRAAVGASHVPPDRVEEVFMGNVCSAGVGQAPARQAALLAGLSHNTPCTTINKVCASGMKALMLGALGIQAGGTSSSSSSGGVVVVGGMEAMSRVPYYLPQAARSPGLRLGAKNKDARLVDGLVHDGLWDVYNDQHMGVCGDLCAGTYGISREEQDDYTLESYRRAQQAWDAGHFDGEVVPLDVGDGTRVVRDDEVGNVRPDKLRKLRAVFTDPGGTVTAANSSKISDGAAAMVLMSGKRAREFGLVPLFRVRGFADAARAPVEFTVAPADAVRLAVQRAGVTLADVAYHEINEAFAVVPLVNVRLLGLDLARVNVHGGAVALGHPIGCSGARIVGTLYSVLKHRDAAIGCASICNGGGGASAVVIERLS